MFWTKPNSKFSRRVSAREGERGQPFTFWIADAHIADLRLRIWDFKKAGDRSQEMENTISTY